MTTLADAVLAVMLQLSPEAGWTAMPGHAETVEARHARYASIAADIAQVAPTVEAATLVLATAHHESGFARDVDAGDCYRGPGYERRCDGGRAVCLMQIQARPREREAARTDRRECLRQGLVGIRRSLRACAGGIPAHRFAGLSGSCARGLAGSRQIDALVRRTDGLLRIALAPPRPET